MNLCWVPCCGGKIASCTPGQQEFPASLCSSLSLGPAGRTPDEQLWKWWNFAFSSAVWFSEGQNCQKQWCCCLFCVCTRIESGALVGKNGKNWMLNLQFKERSMLRGTGTSACAYLPGLVGTVFIGFTWQGLGVNQNPNSPSPCAAAGKKESGVKWSLGKRGERWFMIWFYFSLSHSDLIGNKFNQFPRVKSTLPVTVIDEWSLPILISSQESLIVFCPAGETRGRAAMEGTWHPAEVNILHCYNISTKKKPFNFLEIVNFLLFLFNVAYYIWNLCCHLL